MYIDHVNYCVKCGFYPALLELFTLLVDYCINTFFNIFFPNPTYCLAHKFPLLKIILFYQLLLLLLYSFSSYALRYVSRSMVQTRAWNFFLFFSWCLTLPSTIRNLWLPMFQSFIFFLHTTISELIHTSIQQIWHTIYRVFFISLTNVHTIRMCALVNIHSHIYTRSLHNHFIRLATVYYYIIAFNLLFFLRRFYVILLTLTS